MHQLGITCPIIGAGRMAHLEEAVTAVNIKLSSVDIAYLEDLYQPHPILGHG